MSWFSLVIGQKGSLQLATSSENLVPVLNFWSHWRPVSPNFEPYKLSCNTPTKSAPLTPFNRLGNKLHKLCIYSPEPPTEVYCLRLNFNISKLV